MKWILRYLQGTADMGLIFNKAKMENSIIGFVNLDYEVTWIKENL